MNPTPAKDDPLKLHELVGATAFVVAACASVAVAFTVIATCQYGNDLIQRIRRKNGSRDET